MFVIYSIVSATDTDIDFRLKDCRSKVKIVRVLSLDSGATRGVVEAVILREIESRTNKRLHELFHIVGGTSIGCVAAASISVPLKEGSLEPKWKVSEVGDIIKTQSKEIFRWRFPWGSISDTDAYEKMISDICGDTNFNEAIIPTVGVTFNCLEGKSKIICSLDETEVFKTSSVMLASSAVPLVFKNRTIQPVSPLSATNNTYWVMDGVIGGAGDPTSIIIGQAKKYYPNVEKFEVVSIGCGTLDKTSVQKAFGGICAVQNLFFQAVNLGVKIVNMEPSNIADLLIGDYRRFDPPISKGGWPFDTSDANYAELEKETLNYLDSNKDFDTLMELFKSRPRD